MAERRAEAAVVRLAAHLFLTRRGVRFLVQHALRSYQPPLRLLRAQPESHAAEEDLMTTFAAFYGDLLLVLLRGPTDLVLWGKGHMALTTTAKEARWLHWFNLFASGSDSLDSTLAINLPALVAACLRGPLLAFYELFGNCEAVWLVRERVSVYAEERFAHCRQRHVLAALYPTGFVIVEFLVAVVAALRLTLPPSEHETLIPRLMLALLERLTPAVNGKSAFFRHLDALCREHAHRGVESFEARLGVVADDIYALAVHPAFEALRTSAYDMGPIDALDPTTCWTRTNAPPLGHFDHVVEACSLGTFQ